MLTGELKKELIDVLVPIVENIQKTRVGVSDEDVAEFMRPRQLRVSARLPASNEPPLTSKQMEALNAYLETKSYVVGHAISLADSSLAARVASNSGALSNLPHVSRWLSHVRKRLATGESFPSNKDKSALESLQASLG
jgi:glutathione S-transferase